MKSNLRYMSGKMYIRNCGITRIDVQNYENKILVFTTTRLKHLIPPVCHFTLLFFCVRYVNSWTAVTYFSSTWRQGGHFIASHVFHCTCRTLYTCPNPPEPIFSQLPNSEQSKVLNSPIFPWGESRTSISVRGVPPAGSSLLFLLFVKEISVSEHPHRPAYLWALPYFFPPNVELHVAPPSLQVKTGAGPASVTSLPGFATQGRNGKAEKEVEVGTLHQAIVITIVFSELLSRCPHSH